MTVAGLQWLRNWLPTDRLQMDSAYKVDNQKYCRMERMTTTDGNEICWNTVVNNRVVAVLPTDRHV